MAENDNASKSSQATPKQAEKATAVGGSVTIQTGTFDPHHPLLLDQAADAFKAQVAETHSGKSVSNVAVAVAVHKVGESVTYDVTGEIAG